MKRHEIWQGERGFTLTELMVTIIIMGIVFAIASSSWFGAVESRRVDSATNQLAGDLRQAHSMASNRLVAYQVIFANGSSSYQFGPAGYLTTRTLPDGVKVSTSLSTIVFKPDGSVTGATGAANEIVVSKTSPATNPKHGISINPVTSEIKVVP